MALQIVMDRNGDTRHQFDRSDSADVASAIDRFDRLTRQGYRAVALGKNSESGRVLNDYDPTAERVLFIPHLQGG